METILYIVILLLILGVIIFIHELGHFFFAKKFGVHIYEFSLGMGPVVYSHLGKDKIKYNIRAIPIGGFVAMAGEVYEDDESNKIPKKDFMCNKKWHERLLIMVAGVMNNFILAFVVLFLMAIIYGGALTVPTIEKVTEGLPADIGGLLPGDKILTINGYNIRTWDSAQIAIAMDTDDGVYTFVVDRDGSDVSIDITPEVTETDGILTKVFGINIEVEEYNGFVGSIKYAFIKFYSVIESMIFTLYALFTGKIGVNALSGPIGMYQVVEVAAASGFINLMYLLALLSINVGILNILPIPAFDGGRILFLIIEKIMGKPINQKIEGWAHYIGFILLILLSLYVAFNDIIRMFF